MRTPRTALVIALLATAVAAGTGGRVVASASVLHADPRYPTTPSCLKVVRSQVRVKGHLTVATDTPAQTPWFVAGTPSNGKGYEAAVAYRVALILGFKHAEVSWLSEPYAASTQPGAKPFDFDINEIAYSKALSSSVSFSISYFNLNESLVALKASRIATHHTPAELRGYVYAVQRGSPSVAFVRNAVRPRKKPVTFKTLVDALAALQAKHVDAIAVDTPEGQALAQTSGLTQFAQIRTTGAYYALVAQKANPLVACLNTALHQAARAGTLARLSKEYLTRFNAIPFIKP